MRALHLHVRPSQITESALVELRQTLEDHPGDDPVLIVTTRETVRLPLTVDAVRAKRLAALAVNGSGIVYDDAVPGFD